MGEYAVAAVLGVAGAIAPALLLLRFVYRRNPDPNRSLRPVVRLYLFSFLTVIPALLLELAVSGGLRFSDAPPPPLARLPAAGRRARAVRLPRPQQRPAGVEPPARLRGRLGGPGADDPRLGRLRAADQPGAA